MADFTLEALKNEIVVDAENLGYKNSPTPNDWKGDQVVADLINLKNLVIDKVSAEMEEIRGTTEFSWYDSLSIDEQEYLRWQTPNGGLWLVTGPMKLALTGSTLAVNGVAGAHDPTVSWWAAADRVAAVAAILPLIELAGSRAEVLWDADETITAGEVGRAFNLI